MSPEIPYKNILNFHSRYRHINNTSGTRDETYCELCYLYFKIMLNKAKANSAKLLELNLRVNQSP